MIREQCEKFKIWSYAVKYLFLLMFCLTAPFASAQCIDQEAALNILKNYKVNVVNKNYEFKNDARNWQGRTLPQSFPSLTYVRVGEIPYYFPIKQNIHSRKELHEKFSKLLGPGDDMQLSESKSFWYLGQWNGNMGCAIMLHTFLYCDGSVETFHEWLFDCD